MKQASISSCPNTPTNSGATTMSTTTYTISTPSMGTLLKSTPSRFTTGRTMRPGSSMPVNRIRGARNCIINRGGFLKTSRKKIRRNRRGKISLKNHKTDLSRELPLPKKNQWLSDQATPKSTSRSCSATNGIWKNTSIHQY